MKKVGIMFATMLLVLSMFSVVSAQADDFADETASVELPELELEDAGATPGDFFYSFDKFFDNVRLSMTFNQEKKIERSLNIAEERLAEAERLAERGEFEKAERTRLEYDKFLGKAERTFEKFEAGEKLDNSEKKLRAISRSEVKFEQHGERLEEMKAKILENVGEDLTEEDLAQLEEMFLKAEERLAEAEERTEQKKSNFLTNHKLLGDLNEEEIEDLLEKIDSEEGIDDFRQMREERQEHRFTQAVERREANLERWKDKLNEDDLTQEEILQIEEKISKEELKLDDFRANFEMKSIMQEDLDECREIAHEMSLECTNLEDEEMKTCLEEAREKSQSCFEDIMDSYMDEIDFDFGGQNMPKGFEDMRECQEEITEDILKCEDKEESEMEECLLEAREEAMECALELSKNFQNRGEFDEDEFRGQFEKMYGAENGQYKAKFREKFREGDGYEEFEDEFEYEFEDEDFDY